MKIRLRIAVMTALALFLFASSSHAQIFGGRVIITRPQHPFQPWWYSGPRRAPSYPEYYHYMNSNFPKYYGGFHANYFQSMGIPSGDIGLRGNGITATPW